MPDTSDDEDGGKNWVVRGGKAAVDSLINGTAEHRNVPGLFGLSVQYQPGKTVTELARSQPIRNRYLSYATDQELMAAGALGLVSSPGGGYHHTLIVPIPFTEGEAFRLSVAWNARPAVKNPCAW